MNSASRCERNHEERGDELINGAERTTRSRATIIEQRFALSLRSLLLACSLNKLLEALTGYSKMVAPINEQRFALLAK